MSRDRIEFNYVIVSGAAELPARVVADYERPEPSVGIQGGWFLTEAEIDCPLCECHGKFRRDEFLAFFGRALLEGVEATAADLAQAERDFAYVETHEED